MVRARSLSPAHPTRVLIMALDLHSGRESEAIRDFYGVDEGRFCLLGEDDF